jgi:hypothetical protein
MASTATDQEALKVVTGEVRLSFVHIFEPYSNDPDKDPKYSVLILIPKKDKVTIRNIRRAQQAALEAGKSKFKNGKIPTNWSDTLHDGDEEKDTEEYPEYEGHMYMSVTANASYPPGVVDRQVRPILDPTEVYSGCHARVSINAFAYNSNGKQGVSFGLRHVQMLRDGEPLGGSRSSAEDDFEPVGSDDDDDLI